MLKVAITGSTGLVGSRVMELLYNDFTFLPLLSKDIDITDKVAVNNRLTDLDFDILLHLAAYTNVDKAETEKDFAYRLNVEGTTHLHDATVKKGKKFILISTEFVFDGKKPPFDEDSIPSPLQSQYGLTKFQAENAVKDDSMIVRIQNPYRTAFEPKKDFMRVIKWLLEQGKTLQMVEDSFITPTFIDDIALGLKYLINNYSPEVYHLVGGDSMSPYEAGKLIARTFNLDESLVQPTQYDTYFAGKAPRPQWAKMISKKNTFHKMKTFEEGLLEVKNMLQ
jgi:dTDP-4-dehydrorhamnose reductase